MFNPPKSNMLGDIGSESLAKIRHDYGLFWSQSIGSGQGYSGPVLGRYVRVCAGLCLYAGTVPAPSPGRLVLLRAGTGPVILCIY